MWKVRWQQRLRRWRHVVVLAQGCAWCPCSSATEGGDGAVHVPLGAPFATCLPVLRQPHALVPMHLAAVAGFLWRRLVRVVVACVCTHPFLLDEVGWCLVRISSAWGLGRWCLCRVSSVWGLWGWLVCGGARPLSFVAAAASGSGFGWFRIVGQHCDGQLLQVAGTVRGGDRWCRWLWGWRRWWRRARYPRRRRDD